MRNTGLPTHLIAKAQPKIGWAWMLDGRGARIRTGGLVDPNDARYRAAPHPEYVGSLIISADFIVLHCQVH